MAQRLKGHIFDSLVVGSLDRMALGECTGARVRGHLGHTSQAGGVGAGLGLGFVAVVTSALLLSEHLLPVLTVQTEWPEQSPPSAEGLPFGLSAPLRTWHSEGCLNVRATVGTERALLAVALGTSSRRCARVPLDRKSVV